MLFPDPLQFILPDVTATVNIPPQCDAGQVPLGSANLPKGIVTDLYESVWDDWEGFINAVYIQIHQCIVSLCLPSASWVRCRVSADTCMVLKSQLPWLLIVV